MTLQEVLVVIGIIVLLLAMLIPSLSAARERMRRVVCANNLHQWGIACQFYRQDHDDFLPTEGTYWNIDKPYTWFNVLPPYLGAPPYRDVARVGKLIEDFPALHVWICPSKNRSKQQKSASGKNQFHYGMNLVLDGVGKPPKGSDFTPGFCDQGEMPLSARRFRAPGRTVFMFDIYPNSSRGKQNDVATSLHGDFANVLFLDGSVAGFRSADFVNDHNYRNDAVVWHHPFLYWGYNPTVGRTASTEE